MRFSTSMCASILCLAALSAQQARAQYSLQSLSGESVAQENTYGHFLNVQVNGDNTAANSSVTQNFTGMDGQGNQQTMTFSGSSYSQSDYGSLHVSTTESITNSYYNAGNSPYIAPNGDVNDPNGSPTLLYGLGRASFTDTLQYGGALQSGYTAIYIFHIDGDNSGVGSNVGITVNVDNNPSDSYGNFDTGHIDTTWTTSKYAVNGQTPQQITVYFQATDEFDTKYLTDGQNYSGAADFSSTLTLTGIELVDANGNLASGWTVTSASGAHYNSIQATPAPAALPLFTGGLSGVGLLLRRRRARK